MPMPQASSPIPESISRCPLRKAAWLASCSGLEKDKASANPLLPGNLPGLLAPGVYAFANAPHDTRLAVLAFALGSYRFNRYRKREDKLATLVVPDGIDAADLSRIADGDHLGARPDQHAFE